MQNSVYSSTRSCFQEIIKQEGFKGLFRGATSILITMPMRSAMNIYLYSSLKKNYEHLPYFYKGFLSGCITGSLFGVFACPIERIKCVMQVSSEFSSSWKCAVNLYHTIGLNGIYRGFLITLCRDVLGFGVFFGTYELIKGNILERTQKFKWWGWLLCGSISGVLCWVSILPLDCVKTRYQLAHHKQSYINIFLEIIRTTGIKGLWVGFQSCAVRAVVSNGIGFFCYESIKHNIPPLIFT